VYASSDRTVDFMAIAVESSTFSRRVSPGRTSSHLGLERDRKKPNENPLLRHSDPPA